IEDSFNLQFSVRFAAEKHYKSRMIYFQFFHYSLPVSRYAALSRIRSTYNFQCASLLKNITKAG
ncbi:hypothetical protein, partial [Salinivirga cyanobacteriivorans]